MKYNENIGTRITRIERISTDFFDCGRNGTRMTRIERISTDFYAEIKKIRVNPLNPRYPRSINPQIDRVFINIIIN
jgi:hypothetical protein